MQDVLRDSASDGPTTQAASVGIDSGRREQFIWTKALVCPDSPPMGASGQERGVGVGDTGNQMLDPLGPEGLWDGFELTPSPPRRRQDWTGMVCDQSRQGGAWGGLCVRDVRIAKGTVRTRTPTEWMKELLSSQGEEASPLRDTQTRAIPGDGEGLQRTLKGLP